MKSLIPLCAFLLAAVGCIGQTTNCTGATQVCNDVSFSGNSSGSGTQELTASNRGCLTVEHQSSWYYFVPVTPGTVALTIQTTVDYDFAIWQTNNCSNLGTPVRCSYSATTGNTGLAATNGSGQPVTDVSEGVGGDKWVMPLTVVAGQTYIMLIDNYTANSSPFTLDWTFTNGATLDCNPSHLPVELLGFMAKYDASHNANRVYWETASERLNDHFTLERSANAQDWTTINQQPGVENSTTTLEYFYEDYGYAPGTLNYYRLSQTDYDGTITTFDAVMVNNRLADKKIVKVFNAMGQEVSPGASGILILLYEDGTTRRILRE